MSETDFIKKWMIDSFKNTAWDKDASSVFWARSYKMPPDELLQMSKDFLAIDTPLPFSSSLNLAQYTVEAECADIPRPNFKLSKFESR